MNSRVSMVPEKDRTEGHEAPGLATGSVEKETATVHPGWDRKPWVSSAEKEPQRGENQLDRLLCGYKGLDGPSDSVSF